MQLGDLVKIQHEDHLEAFATPRAKNSLLLVGPEGSGKRTRCRAFLNHLFPDLTRPEITESITVTLDELLHPRTSQNNNNNNNATNTNAFSRNKNNNQRYGSKEFQNQDESPQQQQQQKEEGMENNSSRDFSLATAKLTYLASPFHYWISMIDFHFHAHILLDKLISQIQGQGVMVGSTTSSTSSSASHSDAPIRAQVGYSVSHTCDDDTPIQSGIGSSTTAFVSRCIVLDHVNKLSHKAQKTLLNMIERNNSTNLFLKGEMLAPCRFVLIADGVEDCLIPALRSRVTRLYFVKPTIEHVRMCLNQQTARLRRANSNIHISKNQLKQISVACEDDLISAMQYLRLVAQISTCSEHSNTSSSCSSSSAGSEEVIIAKDDMLHSLVHTHLMVKLQKAADLFSPIVSETPVSATTTEEYMVVMQAIHTQTAFFVRHYNPQEFIETILQELINHTCPDLSPERALWLTKRAASCAEYINVPGCKCESRIERFCHDVIACIKECNEQERERYDPDHHHDTTL